MKLSKSEEGRKHPDLGSTQTTTRTTTKINANKFTLRKTVIILSKAKDKENFESSKRKKTHMVQAIQ